MSQPALIEDALWLLDMGESPEQVARRLDRTTQAMSMAFRRAEMPDVAQRFDHKRRAAA